MIDQLFDWTNWNVLESNWVNQYYNCILKTPIGDHEAGAQIPLIVVDLANGVLQIITDPKLGVYTKHKLFLTVV